MLMAFSALPKARMLAVTRKRRNSNFGRRSYPESRSVPRTQWAEWINPTASAAAHGASGRLGGPDDARRSDRFGTLMSHAGPTVSLPIASLANSVSLSAGFRPLITSAGSALLPSPSCRATSLAAIALTTVTAAAHKEQGPTARAVTDPWAQRRFGRHRLDFDAHLITIPGSQMIVAGALYTGERLRKLHFLMSGHGGRWSPSTTDEKSKKREQAGNCQRADCRPILRWSYKPADECGQDELMESRIVVSAVGG